MERQTIDDMNIPGFRLHPLNGEGKGRWSIWVNGNWRLTFDILCKPSGKQRVYGVNTRYAHGSASNLRSHASELETMACRSS